MKQSEVKSTQQNITVDLLCKYPDVKIEKRNATINGSALGPGWAAKSGFSTKVLCRKNGDVPTCPIKVKYSVHFALSIRANSVSIMQVHFNDSVVAVRNKLQECEQFPLYIQTLSGKVRMRFFNAYFFRKH